MFNIYINDMLCYKLEIAQKYKKPITYYWFSLGFLLEEYCRLLNKCNILEDSNQVIIAMKLEMLRL